MVQAAVFERGMVGEMVRVEGPPVISCCRRTRPPRASSSRQEMVSGRSRDSSVRAISIDSADRLHVCLIEEPAWGEVPQPVPFVGRCIDNFELTRLPQETTPAQLRDWLGGACRSGRMGHLPGRTPSFVERLGRILVSTRNTGGAGFACCRSVRGQADPCPIPHGHALGFL